MLQPKEDKPIPLNLYKKLHKIIKEGVVVGKNGNNTFHKYKYVTEADVTDAVRQKFTENNILLTASLTGVRPGNGPDIVETVMEFTLIDLDNNESQKYIFSGFGQDKGDKAIYKAYTGAFKYFLMKNLMIGSDADPENDEEDTKKPKKNVLKAASEAIKDVVDKTKDDKKDIWS